MPNDMKIPKTDTFNDIKDTMSKAIISKRLEFTNK